MATILAIAAVACVAAAGASVVMSWASNQSPLWNMVLGGVLAVVVLGGAILIAIWMARAGAIGP